MKLNRIISLCSLAVSLAVLVMLFKKPPSVAQPQAPAEATANVESFQKKILQLEKPSPTGQAPAEVHLNSAEITAAFAQASGVIPMPAASAELNSATPVTAPVDPSAQPDIKDYNVNFEGDVAHGRRRQRRRDHGDRHRHQRLLELDLQSRHRILEWGTKAFSGEVCSDSPQKMRQNIESRASMRGAG